MSAGGQGRLVLRIHGRVQGVFYRASSREQARRLGLTGWVRNCRDGSVELVAEGPPPALERMLEWCREGPPAAAVREIDVERPAATGEFETFSVRR